MSRNLFRLLLIVSLLLGIFLINFPVSMVNAGAKYTHQIFEESGLSVPAANNLIIAIKEKLKEKGYYKGPISDGDDTNNIWQFERALDEYRKDNGLKNDKTLKKTLQSLGLMEDSTKIKK
jgi:hypothetical protein